ncbi:MAG: ribosome silencing factor [Alphaproteobacteria bacterium]|nr:ribosome silencing factor [Alphaproteobacteria bacterium]
MPPAALLELVRRVLEDNKAEDIVTVPLAGKSAIADYLVIASGRSSRQVTATAERLVRGLKDAGLGGIRPEGLAQGDWVLIDAIDVVIHLFRPEVRTFYNLEKMWQADIPEGDRSTASRG